LIEESALDEFKFSRGVNISELAAIT